MARSDKSVQKSLLIIFKQDKKPLTLTDDNSRVGDPSGGAPMTIYEINLIKSLKMQNVKCSSIKIVLAYSKAAHDLHLL